MQRTSAGSEMNLYHISQTDVSGWDTYSDAVVVAESPEQAARIHPRTDWWRTDEEGIIKHIPLEDDMYSRDWTDDPSHVTVRLLGTAIDTVEQVICASFHAG
jgi:2-polyprenyl-6-methoxyphenol hydroxylase-like FAD-dependent oxidoreductase